MGLRVNPRHDSLITPTAFPKNVSQLAQPRQRHTVPQSRAVTLLVVSLCNIIQSHMANLVKNQVKLLYFP